MLKVEEVSKEFGGLTAVSKVSFHVNKCEIVGIIGPNGAGKTTLFNVISGFDPPTQGMIVFDGQDITQLKAYRIVQLGMGRNFQASTLFMELTVVDNVFTGCHLSYKRRIWERLFRLPAAVREETALRRKAVDILEFMGLGSCKNELAKNLPHGYQRILGMCIAMATNPKLLLLDEPLTGMNHTEIETVLSLIRRIRDRGITIAMIEHNMGAVMSLCDRVIVLDHGQKIAEGLPREVQGHQAVIEAYLGRE